MTAPWTFQPAYIAENFDEHVPKHVPHYEQFQQQVCAVADWLLPRNGVVVDVGCSTGTTALAIERKYADRNPVYWLYDESQAMVKLAERKLLPFISSRRMNLLVGKAEHALCHSDADLSLALFTLQFMPQAARRQLLIGLSLRSKRGAALLVAEKVRPQSPRWSEYATSISLDYKATLGVDAAAIRDKERSLRSVLMPNTDDENRKLITDAGWRDVEVLFRWQNWILYGAFA